MKILLSMALMTFDGLENEIVLFANSAQWEELLESVKVEIIKLLQYQSDEVCDRIEEVYDRSI